MARHGPRTPRDRRRRRLGQNFLTDARAIRRVIDLADPQPGDLVVDLGAGAGALTRELAARGATVVAVELDPRWIAHLREATGHLDVEVVAGDVLHVDLPPTPFRVVASPAYHLTTKLLRRLLAGDVPLRDATLVLQRETARRLAGAAGANRFALTWAPWYALAVRERIPRTAFRPIPQVDSAVLCVEPRPVPSLSPARFAGWERFVGAVFDAPGRTAADRLDVVLGKRTAREVVGRVGAEVVRPPSRVPVATWLALFRASETTTTR